MQICKYLWMFDMRSITLSVQEWISENFSLSDDR